MKIGYDAKRLYGNFTGLGNYSRSLLINLQHYHPENDYYLYTPKIKDSPYTHFFEQHPDYTTHQPNTRFKSWWRWCSMIKQLKKDQLDLYHGLSHEIPLNMQQTPIRTIVTIHDLIFNVYPNTYPPIDRWIFNLKCQHSCKTADRIIAISEHTKKDIIKFYGIQADKIDVVYQSCSPLFFEKEEAASIGNFQQFKIPSRYLLSVGTVERRKNLEIIIEAYAYLKKDFQLPLVIVGKGKKYKDKIKALIQKQGLSSMVYWIENLKDNRILKSLYQNAELLVYPSLYEGFGLPVAEALLCKTPVIAAKTSSLPEAGGPHSQYIAPHNAKAWAAAITNVLSDSSLREQMMSKGYTYATAHFSPKTTANQTIKTYQKTLNKNP